MRFSGSVRSAVWFGLNQLFPPICCFCGKVGSLLCDDCLRTVPLADADSCPRCGKPLDPLDGCLLCCREPILFDQAAAAYHYEGAIREAIHQLKYAGNLGLANLFANWLFSVYLRKLPEVDCVAAVPLSRPKLDERGFNQSAWIAKPLAEMIEKPYRKHILQKVMDTNSQVGLGYEERRTNLKNAFRAEPTLVKEQRILLVDDVMTTGATFNECAQTFFEAGAKQVFCLSVATTSLMQEAVSL